MSKRPLVPSFLQKLDDKLLRNKPNTWAARTHLVIWFAVLLGLALSVFCYLAFFDAKQYNSIEGWVTFIGLVAFIGFVFWLIYLLRFNVFKRYGNWFMWDGLKSFALYFVSIGAMVAVCFIPSAIETYRANQQFGNEEIVNDINEINSTACKLEYDLLPLEWKADTCKVVDTIINISDEYTVADTVAIAVEVAGPKYHKIDTAELRTKLFQVDSVVKIHDSLYVFFECPQYLFVSSGDADDYATQKIIYSAEFYRTIIRNYKKPDRPALLKRMEELKTKYAASSRYSYYDEGSDEYTNDTYLEKIKKRYSLKRINNGIDNAVNKKYSWIKNWDSFLRVFYYTTLIITLLVFIFRHTTIKTFFLSVLTAVILAIFTGLMMVMSNGDETAILSFMIVYYALFACIALSIYGASIRRAIQGIALNLFLFMTPFVPLIFVALNEAMKYRRYYEPGYNNQVITEPDNTALYFLIAEIAGSLILLILLEPVFRKLYRKWYAAPEN
ncbi:hypothetical protein [Ferruginibacter sp.]|nr:hypothetical protein [Ferruginibacter sp.]